MLFVLFEMDTELRNTFDLFDRDKSGAISSSELEQVLIALNFDPTERLLRKIMKEMDIDRNGLVSVGIDADMMTVSED